MGSLPKNRYDLDEDARQSCALKVTLILLSMAKKILTVISEWGYWGEEFVGPYDVLTKAGYQLDYMTAYGRKPPALPPSMEEGYMDPPLNKSVTDAHFAKRTTEINNSDLLANPISLADQLPLMPYFNGPSFGLELAKYNELKEEFWKSLLTPTMRCYCRVVAGQWQIWLTTSGYTPLS